MNKMLVYMVTHDKYTAYQIWQLLDSGNKLGLLPHTICKLNPKPRCGRMWMDWEGVKVA